MQIPRSQDDFYNEMAGLKGDALLRRVAAIFERQQASIDKLQTMVALLQVFEENRDVLLDFDEPVRCEQKPLARSFEITARDHLTWATGFHQIEFDPGGTAFRWCGRDGALDLRVFVDRAVDLEVILELKYTVSSTNYDKLVFYDSERVIPHQVMNRSEGVLVKAVLPRRAERRDAATRLHFAFPVVRALSEADARIAAVAFERLAIAQHEAAYAFEVAEAAQ